MLRPPEGRRPIALHANKVRISVFKSWADLGVSLFCSSSLVVTAVDSNHRQLLCRNQYIKYICILYSVDPRTHGGQPVAQACDARAAGGWSADGAGETED